MVYKLFFQQEVCTQVDRLFYLTEIQKVCYSSRLFFFFFFFNSIVCRLHTEASHENKVHTLFNDFTYGFIHYNLSYNSINDSLVTLFLVLIPLNMQKYQKIGIQIN